MTYNTASQYNGGLRVTRYDTIVFNMQVSRYSIMVFNASQQTQHNSRQYRSAHNDGLTFQIKHINIVYE